MQTFKNYINGKWVKSSSFQTFQNLNPSNIKKILGIFPRSNEKDVNHAVLSAKLAFVTWKQMPPPERGKIIKKAGDIMNACKKQLAQVISDECGKTINNSLGDVQSGIDMAYFVAGEGRRWYGRTTHSGLSKRFAMTKKIPIGVIGIIPSWNFPMALTCWKTLPALLCGNTIVLKSEENTPETTVHFTRIMQKAGLPKGVLNLIHGLGQETGDILVNHPDVSMISFTGSSATGKIIGTNCVKKLAKVSLELGGKNAVIIMDDANLELAVNGVVAGAFSLSGQRCTATSRVIVHKKIYNSVLKKLISKTAQLKIGPGYKNSSEVTPIINKKQCDKIMSYIKRVKNSKARIVVGGQRLKGGIYNKGYYIKPTIITNISAMHKISQEEVFGPVLVVFKANSYQHAIQIHNTTQYGLSASLFTQNVNQSFSFFEDVESGVCYINAPTYGSEPHIPFGGVKQSGLGYREAGWTAIDAFSEVKTLYIDYSSSIQSVQEIKK